MLRGRAPRRRLGAHGRGRCAAPLSISDGFGNVIAARGRGPVTIAMAGYDGGPIAADGPADHVVITRSQHIPRIQEAQVSAYDVLCELVWMGFDAVIAPALGLTERDWPKRRERTVFIADHLLFGFVLSELRARPRE
jgi:hypothetical protein